MKIDRIELAVAARMLFDRDKGWQITYFRSCCDHLRSSWGDDWQCCDISRNTDRDLILGVADLYSLLITIIQGRTGATGRTIAGGVGVVDRKIAVKACCKFCAITIRFSYATITRTKVGN
jgi:hypothetical protein